MDSEPPFEDRVVNTFLDNIDLVLTPQDTTSPSLQHGLCIPQKKYQRGAGRGSLDNQGLVLFFLEDQTLLPVNTALREEYTGLIDRDVPALYEAGDTVTLRFEWPGYLPSEFQLRTIDWCVSPNKIPLSKVATEVAKVVEKFIKKMEKVPNGTPWRVGTNGIQTQDLRLGALEQVSTGSWQVRLFYQPTQ